MVGKYSTDRKAFFAALLVTLVMASSLAVVPNLLSAQTSSALNQNCQVVPASTPKTLTDAGVQVAVEAERVAITNEISLFEGEYFQQSITEPDGSVFYSSLVELVQPDPTLEFDLSTIELTIDGSTVPLATGSVPLDNQWVLHVQDAGSAKTLQVFFPGDPEQASSQQGAPSLTVPPTGSTITVEVEAVVGTGLGAGLVISGAECFSRVSTGTDNHATERVQQRLSIGEPLVLLEKSTDVVGGAVIGGSTLVYTLVASVPASHPDDPSLAIPPARSVLVIDEMPALVTPIDEFGNTLNDGDSLPGNGVWNATDWTVTFDAGDLMPGESATFDIPVLVDEFATPSSDILNSAVLDYSALPGDEPGEIVISSGSRSDAVLVVASEAPSVTKSAPTANFDENRDFEYTITVELPAQSSYENFAVRDTLDPAGGQWRAWVSESCFDEDGLACPEFTATRLNQIIQSNNSHTFGWYVNHVPFHDKARTMTFVYRSNFQAEEFGEEFDNDVAVQWNVVDRLGSAVPAVNAWPVFDGLVEDSATVTYNRPALELTKETDRPAMWDYDPADNIINYTVTVTNNGSLTATNIEFLDDQNGRLGIDIDSLQINGATCEDCALNPSGDLAGTLSDIGVGNTVTLTYQAVPTNSGSLTNTVDIVSYSDAEGTSYTDTVSRSTTSIIEEPALIIEKSGDPGIGGLVGTEINFDFTVRNDGAQAALLPRVIDTPPSWLCPADGDLIADALVTPSGHEIGAQLLPGASYFFSATFEVCGPVVDGLFENTATARWNDLGDDRNEANALYGHSDTHEFEVTIPSVAVSKFPSVDAPGVVDQTDLLPGGITRTGEWEVTVENTSAVEAIDLLVSDPLPAGMEYEIGTANAQWSGTAHTLVDNSTPASSAQFAGHTQQVELVIERLEAGESVTINIPFKQTGQLPEPPEVVNTVVVSGGNLPVDGTTTAQGAYEIVPLEPSPRITKSATPDEGGIGEEVTFTIDVLLQGSLFDLEDVVIRDIVPDGFELTDEPTASPTGETATWTANGWGAECISGDCDQVEFIAGYLGSRTSADPASFFDVGRGETELQWFLGDFENPVADADTNPFASATQDTLVRLTYTARVLPTFDNGTEVVNGAANEPLVNVVRSHFNRDVDRGGLASGDLVDGWESGLVDHTTRDRQSARTVSTFDIVGPIIDFDKSARVGGADVTVSGAEYGIVGDVALVNAGNAVTYQVEVTNTGDGTAYDVVVSDDLANGSSTLIPGTISTPAGTACTPTGGSPETLECVIDQIPPGGAVVLSYQALAPDVSDFTENAMRFINRVRVEEFFENDDGVGHQYTQGESFLINLAHAPTPSVRASYSGPCLSSVSPTGTVALEVRAGQDTTAFNPPLSAVAVAGLAEGYSPILTFTVPSSMSIDTSTIMATGPLAGDSTYTTFQSFAPDNITVNADNSTTLEWTTSLPNVPHAQDQVVITLDAEAIDPRGSNVVTGSLALADQAGNRIFGANVGTPEALTATHSTHCGGGGGGGGNADHSVVKSPDSEDSVQLLSRTPNEFEITLTNQRSVALTNVELIDTLPADIVYLGADPTETTYRVATVSPSLPGNVALEDFYQGTITNPDGTHTVTWSGLPDLPAGSEYTITFPVAGADEIVNPDSFQTNTFELFSDQGRRVDTGEMYVSNLEAPVVVKTSDATEYGYDQLINYTVEVTIPADYQGRDLRIVDFINTSLNHDAYPGEIFENSRAGAFEYQVEAPVKFEGYTSAECISGCGDPNDPANDLFIDPIELSPLPLVLANDYDGDNELVPDGSYKIFPFEYFNGTKVFYYSDENNMIGWLIGDIDPVPNTAIVRQDRVLRFEYQVRTPLIAELEDAYVANLDGRQIWRPALYDGPIAGDLDRVQNLWDRTKRNTTQIIESVDNTTGDLFWDGVDETTTNTDWFGQYANGRVSAETSHDVQIQFPYVTIEKHCAGLDGESPVEPLLQGEARNALCTITLENQSGAPAFHLDVLDESTNDFRRWTSTASGTLTASSTYNGTIDAVLFGQGSEFLNTTESPVVGGDGSRDFAATWNIDQLGPHSSVVLEFGAYVDGWSTLPTDVRGRLDHNLRVAGSGNFGRLENNATLEAYRMNDDPLDGELVVGGTVDDHIDFFAPKAQVSTWFAPVDTASLSPNRVESASGINFDAFYAGWQDPLQPPEQSFSTAWWGDPEARTAHGVGRQFWTDSWLGARLSAGAQGLNASETALVSDDSVWAPSLTAELDQPYTWNINLRVSNTDLFEEFELTNTLPYGWEFVPDSARIIDGEWIQPLSSVTAPSYLEIPLANPVVTAQTATSCANLGIDQGEVLEWTFSASDPGPRPIWDIRYLDRTAQDLDEYHRSLDFENWVLIQFDAIPTTAAVDCDADPTAPGNIYFQNEVDLVATPRSANAQGVSYVAGAGYENSNFLVTEHDAPAPMNFPVSLSKTPDGGIVGDGTATEFVVELANFDDAALSNVSFVDQMITTPGSSATQPENWVPFHTCGDVTAQFRALDGSLAPAPGFSEVCNVVLNSDNTHQHDFEWTIAELPVDTTLVITVPLTIPSKDDVPERIANDTRFDNDVSVELPDIDTTLTDSGDITVRFPSPPPNPRVQRVANTLPAINEIVNWRTYTTMPPGQFYQDLLYTTTIPDGQAFESYGEVGCNGTCPFDVALVELLPPVVNSDGTTTIGWWLGDFTSNSASAEQVFFPFDTRTKNEYVDGTNVTHDDSHVASALGYAHQEDLRSEAPLLDDVSHANPPESASGSAFFYQSDASFMSITVNEPQLSVAKTARVLPIGADGSGATGPAEGTSVIEYTIVVSNTASSQHGYNIEVEDFPGSALENIVMTSTPAGTFFTDGWTESDPRLGWFIPELANNESVTFTYTAEVIDDFAEIPLLEARNAVRVAGGYVGTPLVEPGPNDRVYGPTGFVRTVVPLAGPEIEITKHIDGCVETVSQATRGQATSWCLLITNNGSAPALGVEVTDELPAAWSYESGSSQLTGVLLSNDEPTVTSESGATLLDWGIGDLDPGQTVTIEFEATPLFGSPLTVTNEAFAVGFVADGPDAGTELDAAPQGVDGFFDNATAVASLTDHAIQVTKSPVRSGEPVALSGGPVDWTITVTNPFDTGLTNVEVIDLLPAGFVYTPGTATSADGIGFSETNVESSADGGTTQLSWKVDALGANSSFTINLPVVAQAGIPAGTTSNIVEASADEVLDSVFFEAFVELYPVSTTVGRVWVDANSNGVQDPSEEGLDAITVTLTNAAGNPLFRDPNTGEISTTQGATGVALRAITGDDPATPEVESGWYEIGNVRPGDYRLAFATPAGHTPALQNVGSDDSDSDINPITGQSNVFSVEANVDIENIDAGFVAGAAGEIRGQAWNDDGNGTNDANEGGRSGVLVNLLDTSGNILATATTGTDGAFVLSNVPPGDFTIEYAAAPGHAFTLHNEGGETADSDVDPATGRVGLTVQSGASLIVDAGFVALGSISGEAWADSDGDGTAELDEETLDGVAVELLDEQGNVLATRSTGPGGQYSFTGVFPGEYAVRFVSPTGHTNTFQNIGTNDTVDSDTNRLTGEADVAVAAGEDVAHIDSGFVPGSVSAPSISGVAWQDNADGTRDSGEAQLPGVVVNLVSPENVVLAVTATNALGEYLFASVPPGEYVVEFVAPTDQSFTFRNQGAEESIDSDVDQASGRASLTLDESDQTIDAGLVAGEFGSISGLLWVDEGNGLREPAELPHENVTVSLIGPNSEVVAIVRTNAAGQYQFTNVPPGSYEVEIAAPVGYLRTIEGQGAETEDSDTSQLTGRAPITLSSGQATTVDAGHVLPASISGLAWIDDVNGIREDNEQLHEGVVVRLLAADGTEVATRTTDVNGEYAFVSLFPGRYTVEFETPAGYLITEQDQGIDNSLDSDIDPANGQLSLTAVTGVDVAGIDGGFILYAEISGKVWVDDGDGVRALGESVNPGVTVNLLDADGNVAETVVSGPAGSYVFTRVVAGQYQVEFVTPTGQAITFRDQGDDDSVDSDADRSTGMTAAFAVAAGERLTGVDSGFFSGGFGEISGSTWVDGGDGVRGPEEALLEGAVVTLYGPGNEVLAVTTTGAQGEYVFAGIPEGSYEIEFTTPVGFIPTLSNQGEDENLDSDTDPQTGRALLTVTSAAVTAVSAGFVEAGGPATISGTLWNDEDGKGVRSPGEEGISGETVQLVNNMGVVVLTTVTNLAGEYVFSNLPPGTFVVQFPEPGSHAYSFANRGSDEGVDSDVDRRTARSEPIEALAGQTTVIDVGAVVPGPPAAIAGTVFLDPNVDAIQGSSEGEAPAGITVNLIDPEPGEILESVVPGDNLETTGAESGYYEFGSLPPGEYTLEFVDANGLVMSPSDEPNSADPETGITSTFVLSAGALYNLDVGFSEPVEIGGLAWSDRDRDDVRDASEDLLAGVSVQLVTVGSDGQDGAAAARAVTDENGSYLFSGLRAGDYRVVFDLSTIPEGTEPVERYVGNDPSVDSNSDSNGRTGVITAAAGSVIGSVDLGAVKVSDVDDPPPIGLAFSGSEAIRVSTLALLLAVLGAMFLAVGRGRSQWDRRRSAQ